MTHEQVSVCVRVEGPDGGERLIQLAGSEQEVQPHLLEAQRGSLHGLRVLAISVEGEESEGPDYAADLAAVR